MATKEEQMRQDIRTELETEFLEKFKVDLAEARQELTKNNDKLINATLEDLRKQQTPLGPTEIESLLSQEYASFNLKVKDKEGKALEFTLIELPQAIERQFYSKVKEVLMPRIKDLGSLTFELLEGDIVDKIKTVIETFDPMMDLMADAVVLCLNPYGEKEDIDKDWVVANMSSSRMWSVLQAQIHLNRLRDFFSDAFQSTGMRNQTAL